MRMLQLPAWRSYFFVIIISLFLKDKIKQPAFPFILFNDFFATVTSKIQHNSFPRPLLLLSLFVVFISYHSLLA